MGSPEQSGVAADVLIVAGTETTARLADEAVRRAQVRHVDIARDTEQALTLLSDRRWDAVLWEAAGQALSGLPGLREIVSRQPDAAVVVLASLDDLALAARAVEAGANAYVVVGPQTQAALQPILVRAIADAAARGRLARMRTRCELLDERVRLVSDLCPEPLLFLSPAGIVVDANRAAEDLIGLRVNELAGMVAAELFSPDDIVPVLVEVASGNAAPDKLLQRGGAVLGDGEGAHAAAAEAFLRQAAGSFVQVRVVAGVVRDDHGAVREVLLLAQPASREEILSAELAAARQTMAVLLESINEGVAVADAYGVVARANEQFAELVGVGSAQECAGRAVEELLGDEHAKARLIPAAVEQGLRSVDTLRLRREDGTCVSVQVTVAPLKDAQGRSAGIMVLVSPADVGAASQAVEGQAAPMAEVLQAAAMAQSAEDAREVLRMLLDAVSETLAAEAAAAVVSIGSEWEPISVCWGISPQTASSLAKVVLDRPESEGAEERARPVIVADLRDAAASTAIPELVSDLLAQGIRSCAHVELQAQPQVRGIVWVGSTRAGAYTASEAGAIAEAGRQVEAAAQTVAARLLLARARQTHRELSALSVALAQGDTVDAVMEEAVRGAVRVVEGEWAAVHLLERAGQELDRAMVADAQGEVSSTPVLPPAAQEAAWQAVRERRTVVRHIRIEAAEQTLVAAGVDVGGDADGVLIVAWSGRREVDGDARELIHLLARMTGSALVRARLSEQEASASSQMRAKMAEALALEARARDLLRAAVTVEELTELDEILSELAGAAIRVIGLEQVAIYLADHEAGELKGAVMATATAGVQPLVERWPLQAGRSVYADAALSDNPYIVAPLRAGEEEYQAAFVQLRTRTALVGLMVGANPTTGRSLSPQELRLFRALGGLASVAIDRARMEELRETMARSMSHEIRAPLASIRAYLEVVLDEGVGPINQEQRVFLQRAAGACDYLQRLVEDLLDLSRLRAGEAALRPSATDLRELIDQILDTVRTRAEENEIQIEVRIAPEVEEIYVDRTRLAQVLTNLIDNAVKFNYQGGQVIVQAERHEGEVVISVSDTGPGIPDSEQEAIFDEFYRGKGELVQSRAGSGLGLAIARRIAHLLGGTLTVESEVGRGSTFRLRFPYRPAPSAESGDDQTEVKDSGDTKRVESPDRR